MHNLHKLMQHNESSSKRKFIAPSACIKNLEKSHISNLTAYLKALEQKEANIPKRRRKQEIIKLGNEINKIETDNNTKNQ